MRSPKVLKGWNWLNRYRKLRRFKKDNKVDVSISFLEGADYLNVLSRTKREKVILSIRGSKLEDREISGLSGTIRKNLLIPKLYKRADLIVTVSHGIKDEMIGMGIPPEKVIVIPNGYDFRLIDSLASKELPSIFSFLKSRTILLNVGRLHPQKNQIGLLKVFRRILDSMPKLQLVLVGDGPYRVKIKAACNLLGLTIWENEKDSEESQVILAGYQENVFPFYRISKLFVLSSEWEGFPNALAEAMICKTPVIASDCETGPREILNENGSHGVLLDPLGFDPDDAKITLWKSSILEMIDNATSAPTKGARERMQEFEIEKIKSMWEAVV